MQVFGWLLFVAGALLLFFSGFVGVQGIANLSGVIVGMAMSVCGAIFAAAAYAVEELKQATASTSATLRGGGVNKNSGSGHDIGELTDFQPGDRNLDTARYQIYLSKKYDIKKSGLFEKYVCDDELFDTLDGALDHADQFDREREAAFQEQNEKRLNTVVRRGVIGPRKKFDFAELTTGEVVVDHPSGVSKRFKSYRAAELYLLGFMTTEDTLIDMKKDTKPD